MKTSRILILIFITAISSCISDDDEINQGDELLGYWQRSDASDIMLYTLNFHPDNYGFYGISSCDTEGFCLGLAESFYWMTTDNPKTLIVRDDSDSDSREIINSTYYINADGQLFLSCFTDLHFNKIE